MRLGITANAEIPEAIRVCRLVLSYLKDEDVVLETGIAKLFGKEGRPVEEMEVDVLITVGGDGTILRSLQRTDAPVFGINAGMLGFLTEVSHEANIQSGLERLLSGEYFVDHRLKLKAELNERRLYDAMNEVVIHTAHIAKIRQFRVYVDDQLAMNVRSDGIIIATPTGSTSYSMSVGGPVIDPRVEAFVLSPMAPFRHNAESIVVPASSEIMVELEKPKPCLLVIDGQQEEEMTGDEVVRLSRSEKSGRFMSFQRDFYSRFREKLMGIP